MALSALCVALAGLIRLSQVAVDELFSALRGTLGHLPRSREVALVFDAPTGLSPTRTAPSWLAGPTGSPASTGRSPACTTARR